MREVSLSNFGLLVAYLLPGFASLWGIAPFSSTVQSWLNAGPASPTVGGFLYTTLASLGAGLVVSTVRWAVIDAVHHATGLRQPRWHFDKLQPNLQAFELLVESHYRFYQFYANMTVSFAFILAASSFSRPPLGIDRLDLAILAGMGLFWIASRDTLRKYYARTTALLH